MARDFKKNRSDSYQWVLIETPFSQEMMVEFTDSHGITGKLNSSTYSEEKYELQDKLKQAYWRLIDTRLTPRQRQVLRFCADGYTQIEIAKQLKVNQSSITKSINGNCDYRNGKKIYGGAKKKLRKLVDEDPEIQEILRRIAELEDDNYF